VSQDLLNLVQNFIIVSPVLSLSAGFHILILFVLQTVGLLVGSLVVALRVTNGQLAASDFVFFVTYLAQVLIFSRCWVTF
jgi:hypothetical protein